MPLRIRSQSSSAGVGIRYPSSPRRTLLAASSWRRASVTAVSSDSAATPGCRAAALFSALRAKAGDHLDDQVDLIRQQRVEIDKAVTGKLGQLDVGSEPRVFRESASVRVKEVA